MKAPRPFTVDPEVIAAIRPMEKGDAPAVAGLHHAAMGQSLWARLGIPFLTCLYEALLEQRRFIAFVYVEDGEIRGMIAGSEDPPLMYREALATHGPTLARAAAGGILRQPAVLTQLASTGAYFSRSSVDAEVEAVSAESLFCSFAPHLRGRRISGHINKVLFDELAWRGHSAVKITTEVTNEGAVRQLTSWGFEDRGRFTFYGKEMIAYLLDLRASPRVEPARRHPASPRQSRPWR